MTLLDSIVDAIIDGHPPTLIYDPPPCRYPHLSPLTGYKYGCHCDRCRGEHAARRARKRWAQ